MIVWISFFDSMITLQKWLLEISSEITHFVFHPKIPVIKFSFWGIQKSWLFFE
jgi:hypothetical protein